MPAHRLSRAALVSIPAPGPGVEISPLIGREVGVGIVHLGIGAFHRAHQAVYTEAAMLATGENTWGICGVSQRSDRVTRLLGDQDCLYGVLSRGRETTGLRVVGAVRAATFAGRETPDVLATIAAPTTHVVSLTVSEKAYRMRPAGSGRTTGGATSAGRGRGAGGSVQGAGKSGPGADESGRGVAGSSRGGSPAGGLGVELDLDDPAVAADLATLDRELEGPCPDPALTPIGLLARGLARRLGAGGAPVNVVCCDNMVDNGQVVADLVRSAFAALPAERGATALEWMAGHVSFPSTMVDRIVPAAHEADRALATELSGLRDEALVVAEPFTQWVIQDDFAAPRPAWEVAGAILTGDVLPYEQAKLRMLNASHSLLAYRGALLGHRLLADAVADPALEADMRRLLDQDVIPTLTPPAGMDLARYREDLIERFRNPNTGHTTIQIAMDGSQKIPIRLLGTVADDLAAGHMPDAAAKAVAAWMLFVARGRDATGRDLPLDDPMAEALRQAAAGPLPGLAGRMMGLRAIFPDPLAARGDLVEAIQAHVEELAAELDRP